MIEEKISVERKKERKKDFQWRKKKKRWKSNVEKISKRRLVKELRKKE